MTSRLTVVDILRSAAGGAHVQGAIEAPQPGVEVWTDTLEVIGWAGGLTSAAQAVEITAGRTVVAHAPIEVDRPDVRAAFPDMPTNGRSGFHATIGTAGFAEMELEVAVLLGDGGRHPLGVIRAQRDGPPPPGIDDGDLVSVVVLARRDEQAALIATLESVVAQTYAGFDVTVVGATLDHQVEDAVASFPGVRSAPRPCDARSEAWNVGLDASTGGYVAFLPAGARLGPRALAGAIGVLRAHPGWGFVTGQSACGAHQGRDGGDGGGLLKLLRARSVGSGAAVVYRRAAIEAVGRFDARLLGEEHYDLALRIARRFEWGVHREQALEDERVEIPPVGGVSFGSLRRVSPLSRDYGYDRGRPIDRYYIEAFLDRRSADVRGDVLEVSEPTYTRRFGGDRVATSAVLSLTDDNPAATVIGDLADAPQIPDASFDCVVLTQTLHLIHDIGAAVDTVHRILRPGGTVLATVPGITQLERVETWHWSLTPASATRLFVDRFGLDAVTVESHGNVLAATAFLYGLAVEELSVDELDHRDPDYPVTVAVRAVRSRDEP